MHSLENRVRGNLKCHFGGLAIVIPDLEASKAGEPASQMNPKAPDYDVEATRKAAYEARAELAYNGYGTGTADRPGNHQAVATAEKTPDLLLKARQKVFDTLKASPETTEVSDLYLDNRYGGTVAFGAFAPIFFIYRPSAKVQLQQEAVKETAAKRFYCVYNGKFLIMAAFSEPGMGIPALSETASEVCLLMSKSGYEFHWLLPIPTLQSLDLGGTSTGSSPLAAVLNDSAGRVGTTTMLRSMPRSVQESLRSLYSASFEYMSAFCSLREEADTRDALLQTIDAHRETVLDLMHEFNQTKGRQFLKRRKLRGLIRNHCFNLTEKIGRVDAVSDSLSQGIISLETNLQREPYLRSTLGREPDWKSYLRHDFDTKPVLDMITRTDEEINRPDTASVVFWVALVAAAAGAIAGTFISRIV